MSNNLPKCETLLLERKTGVLYITLNRCEVRNAMNLLMVRELGSTFDAIANDAAIRAVVIRGAEQNFCAGGDIKDLSQADTGSGSGADPLYQLNRSFGRLITQVHNAPQVVIVLLEGAVLGGGFGLACVSDIAITDESAQFGMPETTLGVPPAQIAPFVVARTGLTNARRLILTGARFNGAEACAMGVAHFVTTSSRQMKERLEQQLQLVMRCAPGANRVTKALILDVGRTRHEELLDQAAVQFAAAVRGDEGREGMRAFIEKRPASWVPRKKTP